MAGPARRASRFLPAMKFKSIASSLLLAAATVQWAAAQPAKTQQPVTRDELRACMNAEAELAGRRQALEAQNRRNGDETAAIRSEAQELQDERKRVEQEPSRTERFERRVRAHNVKVEAARGREASLRSGVDGLNQAVAAHNERCGGIAFRPEDKEAILQERAAAGK